MSYRTSANEPTAEVGFAMAPHLWGTGIFCPAAQIFLDFLFANWNVTSLTGRTLVRNHRALGALRKLGASIVGETTRDLARVVHPAEERAARHQRHRAWRLAAHNHGVDLQHRHRVPGPVRRRL